MTTEQMIEEAVKLILNDYECSGQYACNHETTERHVVIWEDDLKKELQLIATKSAEEIVEEIDGLIEESGGVYGLHMNGEPATWEWLINNGWLEKTGKLLAESKDTNE